MIKIIMMVNLFCISINIQASEPANNVIKVTGTAIRYIPDEYAAIQSKNASLDRSIDKSVNMSKKELKLLESKKNNQKYSITLLVEERGISASKTKAVVDSKISLIDNISVSLGADSQNSQLFNTNISSVNLSTQSDILLHGMIMDVGDHRKKTNNKVYHANNDKVIISTTPNSLNHDKRQSKMGFLISQEIMVSLPDENSYLNFLDKIIKLNVKSISFTHISSDQIDEYYQSAFTEAVIDANKKGTALAKQLKGQLGEIIDFQEISKKPLISNGNVNLYNQGSDDSPAVLNDQNAVVAQVIITFSFER